jgi:methyl-accepting chemotaxis protein
MKVFSLFLIMLVFAFIDLNASETSDWKTKRVTSGQHETEASHGSTASKYDSNSKHSSSTSGGTSLRHDEGMPLAGMIGVAFGAFLLLLLVYIQSERMFKFSLATKLIGGVTTLLVILVALGVFSAYEMKIIGDEIEEIAERQFPLTQMITKITEHQLEQELLLEKYLRTKVDHYRTEFIELGHKVESEIKEAERIAEDGMRVAKTKLERESYTEIDEHLKVIEKEHEVFEKDCEEAMTMISKGLTSGLDELLSKCEKLSEQLEHELVAFLDKTANQVTTSAKNAEMDEHKAINLIIAACIFGFSWGLFALWVIANASIGLVNNIKRLAAQLRESSTQVASASSQLSGAAQELSSLSSEQASSVEETSSALEEMSGMVENNVVNSGKAFELSNTVRTESEHGNDSMNSLRGSMKDILASNEKIEELVKVIDNIGDKTKVMDEIVFQTKLLSFNASVEAERAGEHGRGFAVVAQEVGNLAQMSGKAAQEIAEIVKESIRSAETITSENKKRVEGGNNLVVEAAKVLKNIMDVSTTVSEGSNQVLKASKDQAAGIKQINVAMSQVDKATQENAATAEETASTSEELSAQTEVLNGLVGELFALVTNQHQTANQNKNTNQSSTQFTQPVEVNTVRDHKKVINLKNYEKVDRKKQEPVDMGEQLDKVANDGWEKI